MDVILPFVVSTVVVYIMTVVGMGLAPTDLARLARSGRVVTVATVVQALALPAMAVVLALALSPPAHLTVGMIVVASCPPAAIANFFVDMGGWNTALSVALTAVANLFTPFLLPLVLALALPVVGAEGIVGPVPVLPMIAQIAATMILPLAVGIGVRARFPRVRDMLPRLRQISLGGILLVTTLVTVAGFDTLRTDAAWVALLVTVFTGLALGLGLATGASLGLDRGDRLTLATDFFIRHGGIAIFVTTTLLDNVPAAVFVVGVFFIQTPLGLFLSSRFRLSPLSTPIGDHP